MMTPRVPGNVTVDDLFDVIEQVREKHGSRVEAIWMSRERAIAFGAVGFIAAALPTIIVSDRISHDFVGFQGHRGVLSSRETTFFLLAI